MTVRTMAPRVVRNGAARDRVGTTACRQPVVLTTLFVAAAVALGACGGTSSPPASAGSPTVASLGTSGTTGSGRSTITSGGGGDGPTTTPPKSVSPTELVDEWAACERHHGFPNQTDPVIDQHGVINITTGYVINGRQEIAGGPGTPTGTCSEYLAQAQVELRAEDPVAPPPPASSNVPYVNCIRANGVPNYPYAVGDKTYFNGTGVDPNSPLVIRVGNYCGKKLGFPAWWINGWGPPGDISVQSGGHLPRCPAGEGCGPGVPTPGANQRSSANG